MVLGVGLSANDFSVRYAVNNALTRLADVGLRLATLKRINRASDNPAGLIAAEQLSNELAAHESAINAAERTRAFAQTADSALGGALGILNEIQGNLVTAADDSLSPEAKEALQYEIDAGIDAITRLGRTTLGGRQIFGTTSQFLAGTHPTDVVSLDLPAVDDSLGGSSGVLAELRSGGDASIQSGDLELASDILNEARSQILSTRAELGAFEKYAVDSTKRVLQDAQVNLARSLSAICDADVAAEGSRLVREQILVQVSIATSGLLNRSRKLTLGLITSVFDQAV